MSSELKATSHELTAADGSLIRVDTYVEEEDGTLVIEVYRGKRFNPVATAELAVESDPK